MATSDAKILITGLPRTGTTSLCYLLLQLNFKVAHTAYTKAAFEQADVIADTPAYADYRTLSQHIIASHWILLHRESSLWLASIKKLLHTLAQKPRDRFHPLLWRSLSRVLGNDFLQACDQQLMQAYQRHTQNVIDAAQTLAVPLLQIELKPGKASGKHHLKKLLENPIGERQILETNIALNQNRVFAWGEINHHNKISSHLAGHQGRQYFEHPVLLD